MCSWSIGGNPATAPSVVQPGAGNPHFCRATEPIRSMYAQAFAHHIRDNGARLLKFDNLTTRCDNPQHEHLPGIYSTEAIINGVIEFYRALDEVCPDVFIMLYWGYRSPWWLLYGDTMFETGVEMEAASPGHMPAPFVRDGVTRKLDQGHVFAKDVPWLGTDSLGVWLSHWGGWNSGIGTERWQQGLVMDICRGARAGPTVERSGMALTARAPSNGRVHRPDEGAARVLCPLAIDPGRSLETGTLRLLLHRTVTGLPRDQQRHVGGPTADLAAGSRLGPAERHHVGPLPLVPAPRTADPRRRGNPRWDRHRAASVRSRACSRPCRRERRRRCRASSRNSRCRFDLPSRVAKSRSLSRSLRRQPVSPASSAWTPLQILGATSAGGATLTLQDDNSILASGPTPSPDTYTVQAKTAVQGIRALLLETLPHDSLPSQGPGRAVNGNYQLSEIRVHAAPADGSSAPTAVALQQPIADYSQTSHGGWPVAAAVGRRPGHSLGHRSGGRPTTRRAVPHGVDAGCCG